MKSDLSQTYSLPVPGGCGLPGRCPGLDSCALTGLSGKLHEIHKKSSSIPWDATENFCKKA